MDTRFVVVFLVISLLGCGACVGPEVRTDFDPSADFTKFRTYAFAELTDVNKGGILDNSLLRKRLDQMVDQQLTHKGLQQVELTQNPDLLVHYFVGVSDKQRIQSSGPVVGARGWQGNYGAGAAYGGVTTYEYREGTLVIDLVETSKKELVWRATIVAELQDSTERNLEQGNKAIAKAFENYPPVNKPQ